MEAKILWGHGRNHLIVFSQGWGNTVREESVAGGAKARGAAYLPEEFFLLEV